MVRVLFVCLGNICRSPMAEAVFRQLVKEAGLGAKVDADSAGTEHWHVGEAPHHGTQRVLQRNGVPYSGRARLLTKDDLGRFDYIIAMDEQNLADIRALGNPKARVALLMEFAPHAGEREVPDPYYTGRFDPVYQLVHEGAAGLLVAIRRERAL